MDVLGSHGNHWEELREDGWCGLSGGDRADGGGQPV